MKKILVMAVFAISASSYAQVPDVLPAFDYVCVETIDYSGAKDIFQVSLYTRKWVVENGYRIIPDYKPNWPEEAKKDSCSVITLKLQTHDRYRGKYRTSLFVVDCRSDTVFRSEGKSIGSTDSQGFQNAAAEALKDLKKELASSQEIARKEKKGKS